MDLYLMLVRWTCGRCVGQLLTYRNCLFPRLEPRLISELFPTSPLSDRKACYPAARGLYLFLSLPPIYLRSSRECCQVPSRWGRHCKSLIPKLILQQGTSSGQPSHSANTTCIFFLPQVCSISCRLPYPKVNYQIYCTFKKKPEHLNLAQHTLFLLHERRNQLEVLVSQ